LPPCQKEGKRNLLGFSDHDCRQKEAQSTTAERNLRKKEESFRLGKEIAATKREKIQRTGRANSSRLNEAPPKEGKDMDIIGS